MLVFEIALGICLAPVLPAMIAGLGIVAVALIAAIVLLWIGTATIGFGPTCVVIGLIAVAIWIAKARADAREEHDQRAKALELQRRQMTVTSPRLLTPEQIAAIPVPSRRQMLRIVHGTKIAWAVLVGVPTLYVLIASAVDALIP